MKDILSACPGQIWKYESPLGSNVIVLILKELKDPLSTLKVLILSSKNMAHYTWNKKGNIDFFIPPTSIGERKKWKRI